MAALSAISMHTSGWYTLYVQSKYTVRAVKLRDLRVHVIHEVWNLVAMLLVSLFWCN